MSINRVGEILEEALAGEGLSWEKSLALLELDPHSRETREVLQVAHRASLEWGQERGYIWASIGIDYAPCPMSCTFCSLGEKWGIIKESWSLDQQQVLELIHGYDLPQVRWIVLRTTEFFGTDKLIQIAHQAGPLKHAQLVVNTGEFTKSQAQALYDAGFRAAYHVMRLREGQDTGVDPRARLATLQAIKDSPLTLAALVDPIGPEHSNQEIADLMFLHKAHGATLMGAMARFTVEGTPKFLLGTIPRSRLAQITAVSRLVVGRQAQAICTHPTGRDILKSGANTVVVEYGAIPRDTRISQGDWRGFTVEEAARLLKEVGYHV